MNEEKFPFKEKYRTMSRAGQHTILEHIAMYLSQANDLQDEHIEEWIKWLEAIRNIGKVHE